MLNFGGVLNWLCSYLYPIGSICGIFTHIWFIFMVNVSKYTIHGSYRIVCDIVDNWQWFGKFVTTSADLPKWWRSLVGVEKSSPNSLTSGICFWWTMMTHPDVVQPTKTLSQNVNQSINQSKLKVWFWRLGGLLRGKSSGSYQPSRKSKGYSLITRQSIQSPCDLTRFISPNLVKILQ